MIQIKKQQHAGTTVIEMSGSIEESVDFNQLVGNLSGPVVIKTRGVTRINSVGVKAWIHYFQAQASGGAQLVFEECSTAIVEQLNLISNFNVGGRVESLLLPYSCTNCRTEYTALFRAGDLKASPGTPPATDCPKCKGKGEFDDIPEEYLGFLTG